MRKNMQLIHSDLDAENENNSQKALRTPKIKRKGRYCALIDNSLKIAFSRVKNDTSQTETLSSNCFFSRLTEKPMMYGISSLKYLKYPEHMILKLLSTTSTISQITQVNN